MITVYITNYNYGRFLKQAIESVLSQTCQDFELLIIDDGSTDDSKDILDLYRDDDRIKIIYQQNKGLNVSNNIALRLAKGEYIMRLDADDYLEPEALNLLKNVLDSNPDIGLVFPDYFHVLESGDKIERIHRHNFDNEVSLLDQAAHGACTMIRVKFLQDVGGYNENYSCQDGYELWVKFTKKYKVSNLNTPLFNYRQHGSNLTSDENRILSTRAKINADFIENLNIDNSSLAIIPVRIDKRILNIKFNQRNLVNIKIKQALESKAIKKVVVSSESQKLKEIIDPSFLNSSKVDFHHRSTRSSWHNTSLDKTIDEIIQLNEIKSDQFTSLAVLDIKLPLIGTEKISDAINTLHLFGSDSLVSVRPDNNVLYQHNGNGMQPINNSDSFTKLERDSIFRHVGGLTISRFSSFIREKKIINGKVGHIAIDKLSAYKLESITDVDIIAFMNTKMNRF